MGENRAKEYLKDENTCALVSDDEWILCEKGGISPLVEVLDLKNDLRGFDAADKIVGRAAALLYVKGGVKKVHAAVLSKGAAEIFKKHKIEYSFDVLTDKIMNRKGDGICPMEQTVEGVDDPELAYQMIKSKVIALKQLEKTQGLLS